MGAASFWPRTNVPSTTAVLIVPGIAHEERTMSSGITALAEALADDGLATLVIELHGTSQSSGDFLSDGIGERWRADIRAGAAHLRAAGFERVVVMGIRLGALLMLDALRDEPTFAMVAWAPILSGRRHVRELKVMQASTHEGTLADGGVAVAGFDIAPGVLAHLSSLDVARLSRLPVERLLLLDSPGLVGDAWPERAVAADARVDRIEAVDTDTWLFTATDQPGVPSADIRSVQQWCARLRDAQPQPWRGTVTPVPLLRAVSYLYRGRAIRETSVAIGPVGLTGVLSEPVDSPAPSATRLLISTVGPGRTFVAFARDEAARGHLSLRFDFAGFGTSPCRVDGAPGGDLYTDGGRADVIDTMQYLRR